ncbi:hypothetical protein MVEN_01063700 [Mycena venus]|uniref:SnoaL-like domain-containing protein n=1 Tax=Mycena venus TaxID=2733690 RepID=A0A8H6Y8G1_9AGAR|nr:hypothetical protein MVEN_01063700 [Mycena venus]
MTEPIPSESPIEIATAFVEAITAGDTVNMAALMADNYTWRLLPAALGVPAKNKRQYLLQSAKLGRIFATLKVHIRSPLDVVQSGDTVVIHATSEGQMATGAPFQNECIMILRCEGGKVYSMMEFMDSEVMRVTLDAGDGAGWKLLQETHDED